MLSRPVLERIVLVTRDIIERSADRLGGEVDARELGSGMPKDGGRVSRIIEEGIFHSRGGAMNGMKIRMIGSTSAKTGRKRRRQRFCVFGWAQAQQLTLSR